MAKKSEWIGDATDKMERKSTVGSLHRATGTPEGKTIPVKKVQAAAASDDPKLRKKANFALNVRGLEKGGAVPAPSADRKPPWRKNGW